MKIKQKSSKKRLLLLVVSVFLLLGLGVVSYYYTTQSRNTRDTKPSSSWSKPVDDMPDTTEQPVEPETVTTDSSVKNNENTPATQSSTQATPIDITAVNQNETTVSIRSLIQRVTSAGTCSLSVTNENGKQYSETAGIQPLSSFSTCQGFDIPVSSVGSGKWSIVIKYTNGKEYGTASKDFTAR